MIKLIISLIKLLLLNESIDLLFTLAGFRLLTFRERALDHHQLRVHLLPFIFRHALYTLLLFSSRFNLHFLQA